VTITRFSNNYYEGLTADTKPTNVPAGATFRDTQLDIYYEYNGSSWDIIIGNTKTETLSNKTIAAGSNTITGLTDANIDNAAAITTSKLADSANFLLTTNTKTVTNKTMVLADNTVTDTSAAAGDIPVHNGTKFVRKGVGTALQYLRTNSGADNVEWADFPLLSNYQNINIYDVYKISSTYYITNKITNTTTSGTDFAALIQTELDAMTSPAYSEFNFDADDFELDDPIVLPLSSVSVRKAVSLKGWLSESRNWGTRLHPSSSFPTERYLIEGIAADGSDEVSEVTIDGFTLYVHPDFARSLSGTALNGGTAKDVGGIKIEVSFAIKNVISVSNIGTQYLWRGLHLIGKLWYGKFENIMFTDANVNFSGNADLILENGNHTLDSGNPTVKVCHFKNIKALHSGEMDYGILMKSGNYNFFSDVWWEGNAYRTAIIALDNSDASISSSYIMGSNNFYRVGVLDTNSVPSPDNRIAALYLNGSGVIDSVFEDCRLTKYPQTVRLAGGCLNNTIELSGYYGNTPTVVDTGAGENNVVIIQGGFKTTSGQAVVTTTNSLAKILDQRGGAQTRGLQTSSGDGSTASFSWNHGCYTTPANFFARAVSKDAIGSYETTVNSTQITVTYPIAPPSDTNNLKWSWFTSVYSSS
jgi:hypothetical protein